MTDFPVRMTNLPIRRLPGFAAVIALVFAAPLFGLQPFGSPAQAAPDDDRIARLEARILELEKKLDRATRAMSTQAAQPARSAKTGAKQSGGQSAAPAQGQPPAEGQTAANAGSPPPEEQKRDLTPSEFNVFRDNAATLGARKVEASLGFSYQKKNTTLQGDRAGQAVATFRYGLFDGVEASLNVPAYFVTRSTQVAPGTVLVNRRWGMGDISAQVSATLFKETVDWPGVVGTVGVSFPTGRSPLFFGNNYVAGSIPANPFTSALSRGDWAASSSLQIYKTLDPVIIFAGVGVNYAFPVSRAGNTVRYSPQYTYNAGVAFAASEKTTLGFQISGAIETNYKVNGKSIDFTQQEPIIARMVVVQRVAPDTYIEPSLAVGLSQDAPDLVLGLTFRKRF